jgi:hypothetical protein
MLEENESRIKAMFRSVAPVNVAFISKRE